MSHALFQLALNKIEEVLKHLEHKASLTQPPYHLDDIGAAVAAHSNIDEVEYVEVGNDNARLDRIVLGKVEIYDRSPGVYVMTVTRAVVYYRAGMGEPKTRLVVVKELSHLLMRVLKACCVTNEDELEALLDALALAPDLKTFLSATPQLHSEKLAQLVALEILCPHALRRGLLPRYESGELSLAALGEMFGIPEDQVETMFNREYLDAMERIRHAAAAHPPPS